MPTGLSPELAETYAEIADRFESALTFDQAIARITHTAVDAIEGCEAASMTLLSGDSARTEGATSQLADRGDQIQYEEGEGPCLDAPASGARLIATRDLSANP